MSTATFDGVTIAYEEHGRGVPLVLVHGHPFDRSMWRPQVDVLSPVGWRVITPDLRGYGESTVVPGKTTLEMFARDIIRLLDHLETGEVVFGGLSMGGQIVMELYRLFPSRALGLVLADTSPQAESPEGRMRRNDTADQLLQEGMAPYADAVLPKMVAPPNIGAMPSLAQHVLGMMRGTSPQGAAAALRGRAERPDYVEMLSEVAVPTLVVVGRHDEFTPVSDAQLMSERIPDATLAIIDGAAHMPNLERPAEFNQTLQDFLGSLGS